MWQPVYWNLPWQWFTLVELWTLGTRVVRLIPWPAPQLCLLMEKTTAEYLNRSIVNAVVRWITETQPSEQVASELWKHIARSRGQKIEFTNPFRRIHNARQTWSSTDFPYR
eukprot:GILJ01029248.1.p1 GENE.GILJ01029248.1~~GILJ01029248.1.p1  ORF type:complete len:123 (-),score=5.82 GILJ01029248.1:459-791(-)